MDTITDAVVSVSEGRSDGFALMLVACALIAYTMWRDARHTDRRMRESREDTQRTNESLEKVSVAVDRSADAVETLAVNSTKLDARERRDREAVVFVIDGVDAHLRGDATEAERSLQAAKFTISRDSD